MNNFVIWNELCQSVDSGEEGEGWPSYETALTACTDGADMPAYSGPRGLVFGRAACDRAVAAVQREAEQAVTDSARRAAVVASILAQPVAVPAQPVDRHSVLAKMLASNESALAACKRSDKAEIGRLRDNCARLRADLGIKTPEEKLLSAIFGA